MAGPVELWEWQDDEQAGDAQLESLGVVQLTLMDCDGDVASVQMPWREARALGVALVNGTAPWAGR